jgi:hypothetical protein
MEYVESIEDIGREVFEVGEKAVISASGWRFVESSVVPHESVLKFSCNRTRTVDLVITVQKAAKEIWWHAPVFVSSKGERTRRTLTKTRTQGTRTTVLFQ